MGISFKSRYNICFFFYNETIAWPYIIEQKRSEHTFCMGLHAKNPDLMR